MEGRKSVRCFAKISPFSSVSCQNVTRTSLRRITGITIATTSSRSKIRVKSSVLKSQGTGEITFRIASKSVENKGSNRNWNRSGSNRSHSNGCDFKLLAGWPNEATLKKTSSVSNQCPAGGVQRVLQGSVLGNQHPSPDVRSPLLICTVIVLTQHRTIPSGTCLTHQESLLFFENRPLRQQNRLLRPQNRHLSSQTGT